MISDMSSNVDKSAGYEGSLLIYREKGSANKRVSFCDTQGIKRYGLFRVSTDRD